MSAFLHADWPAPPGVRVVTTLRHGLGTSPAPFDRFNLGTRCGDDAATVERNRRELEAELRLPEVPRWLRQVHGTAVVCWDKPELEGVREPEADAAITARPGRVLAILTADCLPVVLAARDGSELGAAHAGWRGLAAGVLEATVAAMATPAERLQAWLGPAAGPQAYEIGEEVHAAFVQRDARARLALLPTRPGHWLIDLSTLARQRLLDAGVTAVHGGDRCTISEPEAFFSHRRDGRSGRMATLAWMGA